MTDATMRLSDLCEFVGEQVDPANHGDEVYVGLEHLASCRFVRTGEGKASDVQSGKYKFRPGDVLYGKLRPYLDKAVLASDAGICTTELLVLRPKHGVDPRFLVAAVHSPNFVRHAVAGTTGVQHPRTSWGHISGFELPAFDGDEQTKIANLIWDVHEAISSNEVAIEVGADLKRAAMRTLFTKGVLGEAQKDTEIGVVPESWDVAFVEDCASAISKGASPKWQGFSYVDEGVLFVRSQNVGEGVTLWKDRAFLPATWNEKEKRSILRAGDVLVNLVGASIGRCAVGGDEIEGANCNQAVCFVRLRQEDLLPGFLCGFLLTSPGQDQIHGSKKDIARANLSLQDVRRIRAPKPSLDEQREIVAILDAIDLKLDLHRRKRAVLDELFRAILHKLMTGEIRVANLEFSALDAEIAA